MALEIKKGDRVFVVVDRSGSMNERDDACDGRIKYDWMQETLLGYVDAAEKYALDGITVVFFNNSVEVIPGVKNKESAQSLMTQHKPRGGTDTHLAINAVFNAHQSTGTGQGSSYVLIFTDGECSDIDALKRSIVNVTKNIATPEAFRIGFFPVGTVNDALKAMFDELDEGLTDAKFDIVGVLKPEDAPFDLAIAAIIDSSTTADEASQGAGYQGKGTTL